MSRRRLLLAAALLAAGAKLLCAALTSGTNDADAFYNFGRFIWEHGLLAQYRTSAEFNHPPLTGWFCALAYGAGHGCGFNFLLRLPGIVADFLVVRALLPLVEDRRLSWGALLALALSPVSLMVSGFHGNFDPVLTGCVVAAALASQRGEPGWCGLWLGLGANVKIIPLLLAPVFFFHWLHRRQARPFFFAATATIALGWSAPVLAIPQIFLRNVLGYSSNWGSWGITSWLGWLPVAALQPVGFDGLTPLQTGIMTALKLGIVALVLGMAWQRRRRPPLALFHTIALAWGVFFLLAPGLGAQYLVWPAPFLLLQPRWSLAITTASSVFLFRFYDVICGGLPWFRGLSTAEALPLWVPWTNLPWLTMGAWLAWSTWIECRRPPTIIGEPLTEKPDSGMDGQKQCGCT